ncbi:MAG: hypothetical protein EPO68_13845, partial [Planctomycetota bacterium]
MPFQAASGVKLQVHGFPDVRPGPTATPRFDQTMWCHLSFDAPGRWHALGVGGTAKLATIPGTTATFWSTFMTPAHADQNAAPSLFTLPLQFAGPPVATPVQRAMSVRSGLWFGEEYDPIAVAQAVNTLWPLGRDAALAELRQFVSEATGPIGGRRDPARIDTADAQIAYFLVRLLFEPDPVRLPDAEFENRVPMLRGYPRCIGGSVIWPADPEAYPDARYPLVVVDDIPFLVSDLIGGRTGSDQCPLAHIEWAERFGRFRERPLQPGGDLIGAAKRAAASYVPTPPRGPTSIRVWEPSQIDAQLVNAVETALGTTRERFNDRGGYVRLDP